MTELDAATILMTMRDMEIAEKLRNRKARSAGIHPDERSFEELEGFIEEAAGIFTRQVRRTQQAMADLQAAEKTPPAGT